MSLNIVITLFVCYFFELSRNFFYYQSIILLNFIRVAILSCSYILVEIGYLNFKTLEKYKNILFHRKERGKNKIIESYHTKYLLRL